MTANIKRQIAHPLTGGEINQLLMGQVPIHTYKDILRMNSINDLFKYNGRIVDAVVLLYLTANNYGHWVAIIRHKPTREFPNGYIEHFDSYGIVPDDELGYASKRFREKNNMVAPHLLTLYVDSDLPIEYNHTKLQRMSRDVSSCGRWSALRIMLKDIPLKKFVKFIREMQQKGVDPDTLITLLTPIDNSSRYG